MTKQLPAKGSGPTELAVALAAPLEGVEFTPDEDQLQFLEARLSAPEGFTISATARLCKIPLGRVLGWFQKPGFITWFRAHWKAANEVWTQEMWDKYRAAGLGGNLQAAKLWLMAFDRDLIESRRRNAPGAAAVAHVTVEIVSPPSPQRVKVLEVTTASPSAAAALQEAAEDVEA